MTAQEHKTRMDTILKKRLSMPPIECNTFIGCSDTLGAVAKGVYLNVLAHIQICEHYERDISNLDLVFDASFHRITQEQMAEALAVLAEEGLLYRNDMGEWCVGDLDNEREIKAAHSLKTRSLFNGGAI